MSILQAARVWRMEVDCVACVSPRNSGYNTPARHGPVVYNGKAGICCGVNTSMGRWGWGSNRCCPEPLEDHHIPGIGHNIYHQSVEENGGRSLQQAIKSLSNTEEKSSNWLWIKRTDKCKMRMGGYGTEGGVPRTLGITVEPSRDVLGLSTKRQWRGVPTWWPQWCIDPPFNHFHHFTISPLHSDCLLQVCANLPQGL